MPRSRTNPQYNLESLPETLEAYQIDYVHLPALGGLRKKSHTVPPETNGFWANQSFHNYADYALSDEFQNGLSWLLREPSRDRPCAIMCSEAVWWRCHRRIVTDYLLYRGRSVFHLMDSARVDQARMNDAATPDGGVLIYPARPKPLKSLTET